MARGHSYVSKAKGHAKSQEYKANVLAWLQTCNDLELTECLQKIALVKDWKLFASTIARAWSAKGGDPEIAHYLLHSEGIPMNLWKSYEREGEIKKRSSTEEEAEGSGQEGPGTQTHEAKESSQAPEAKRKRRAEASLYMKTSSEPVARRDAFLEAEREAQLQTKTGDTAEESGRPKEEEAEAEAAEERQRREEKMRAAASVKSSFVATHFRESSKAKKGTTIKPKKVVKGGKLKNKSFR